MRGASRRDGALRQRSATKRSVDRRRRVQFGAPGLVEFLPLGHIGGAPAACNTGSPEGDRCGSAPGRHGRPTRRPVTPVGWPAAPPPPPVRLARRRARTPATAAQLHGCAQNVCGNTKLTHYSLIRPGRCDMADRLRTGDLRESPKLCQLLLGEHIARRHPGPSLPGRRNGQNETGSSVGHHSHAIVVFRWKLRSALLGDYSPHGSLS